jgi:hypothetical protein
MGAYHYLGDFDINKKSDAVIMIPLKLSHIVDNLKAAYQLVAI